MDWASLCAALLTAVASLLGVYISNRKTAAVMEYRIKQLEDKVNKHNNLIERTYVLEGQVTELQHDVKDLRGRIA